MRERVRSCASYRLVPELTAPGGQTPMSCSLSRPVTCPAGGFEGPALLTACRLVSSRKNCLTHFCWHSFPVVAVGDEAAGMSACSDVSQLHSLLPASFSLPCRCAAHNRLPPACTNLYCDCEGCHHLSSAAMCLPCISAGCNHLPPSDMRLPCNCAGGNHLPSADMCLLCNCAGCNKCLQPAHACPVIVQSSPVCHQPSCACPRNAGCSHLTPCLLCDRAGDGEQLPGKLCGRVGWQGLTDRAGAERRPAIDKQRCWHRATAAPGHPQCYQISAAVEHVSL